jgi:hypothetical protein
MNLKEEIEEIAKETGLVKRKGKIKACEFVCLCSFMDVEIEYYKNGTPKKSSLFKRIYIYDIMKQMSAGERYEIKDFYVGTPLLSVKKGIVIQTKPF